MKTKTLRSFLHQNPAQLFTSKHCICFYTKTVHSFFSVDQMNTKTMCSFFIKSLHNFLHQNPGQVFLVLIIWTPNPYAAFLVFIWWTAIPCSAFLCWSHEDQKPAQLFTLKPCAGFCTKTLHKFFFFIFDQMKTKTLRTFLHQNPAQLFAPKTCTAFYT